MNLKQINVHLLRQWWRVAICGWNNSLQDVENNQKFIKVMDLWCYDAMIDHVDSLVENPVNQLLGLHGLNEASWSQMSPLWPCWVDAHLTPGLWRFSRRLWTWSIRTSMTREFHNFQHLLNTQQTFPCSPSVVTLKENFLLHARR